MMKFIPMVIALAALPIPGRAQERFDPVAAARGGVWIRQGSDPWCVLDAQPLLSFVLKPRLGVSHSPGAFQLNELSASAIACVFPLSPGGAGVALTRFGFELYSEYAFVVAWGAGSGPVRLGWALRYTRVAVRGYGSAGVVSGDAGAFVAPASWIRAGVRLTDVNRPSLGGSGERVPATLSVGVMAVLGGILDCSLQAGQDAGGGISTRGALSVRCSPWMQLLGGASQNFDRLHAGLLLDGGTAAVEYGFSLDPLLGLSQIFSLMLALPE